MNEVPVSWHRLESCKNDNIQTLPHFSPEWSLASLPTCTFAMSIFNTLLDQSIDYAGLFPPAALPLEEVVRLYQTYCGGAHRAWLARLVVPASRLDEFVSVAQTLAESQPLASPPWRISALIPPIQAPDQAFSNALATIQRFNQQTKFAVVDAIEGKLTEPGQASDTMAAIPENINAFLEINFADPDQLIRELAACDVSHAFAKIRTGGVTPDLIPPPERVANFIYQCAQANLGFKATAGLHHPLRAEYALTYEAGAPQDWMHGFFNVFLAACLAFRHSASSSQLAELLAETDPAAFRFEPSSVHWREFHIEEATLQETRQRFFISFGSCSFMEPVTDLQQLQWIPATGHASTVDTP